MTVGGYPSFQEVFGGTMLETPLPESSEDRGGVLFWVVGVCCIAAVSLGAGLASAWRHEVLALAAAERRQEREEAEPPLAGFPAEESAQLVPGFEDVQPVLGITLSADRLTSVLVSEQDARSQHDLFITLRERPTEPFGPLTPLVSCNSSQRDTLPSLSPSGERLLFVRQGVDPAWYLAERTGPASFGSPRRWEPQGVEMTGRWPGAVQFVTEEVIAAATTIKAQKRRELLRVVRTDEAYHVESVYELQNPWPYYRITTDEQRAYYGTQGGVYRVSRRGSDWPLVFEGMLLHVSSTGHVRGPLWITPDERGAVYSSPGPQAARSAPPQAWMINLPTGR